MGISEQELDRLIFRCEGRRRFTQDSPIYADVWEAYGREPDQPRDLLLTPHKRSTAGELATALRDCLEQRGDPEVTPRLAYTSSYVSATLTYPELLRCALPLTAWWREIVAPPSGPPAEELLHDAVWAEDLHDAPAPPKGGLRHRQHAAELRWFVALAGRIAAEVDGGRAPRAETRFPPKRALRNLLRVLGPTSELPRPSLPPLYSMSCNRQARSALFNSRKVVKADAAARVFPPDFGGLGWAIIDSGIDARHPAFRARRDEVRVEPDGEEAAAAASTVFATYDFTRMRDVQATVLDPPNVPPAPAPEVEIDPELGRALRSGREIDFALLEAALRVPHDARYRRPIAVHGTHVAGILAGDWRVADGDLPGADDVRGVAPGLRLYDLRVLGDDGRGEEYSVLAALAFVRWLNARSDRMLIHGVNISLSLDHDVKNFACGRTPVCEECERLVGSGVVVVVAAGNLGYTQYTDGGETSDGYRAISITDPGNSQGVITVGATHGQRPHSYGVSYFSSRGPTGDGRSKPDIVAPGEKIVAPIPEGGLLELDGTSMAAPHVSGAAALLLARYRELIGRPEEVKRLLCSSATDLGRTREFQGSGLVDALRALQAT